MLAFRHFGEDQTTAVVLLAIWIGVGFIFRGTATTVAAISERGLPGRGWLIFYGVISLIAGFVVTAWPFDSIVVLAITTGVWLVIMGVFEIVFAFGIRKDANKIANFRQQFGGQTLKDSKGAAAIRCGGCCRSVTPRVSCRSSMTSPRGSRDWTASRSAATITSPRLGEPTTITSADKAARLSWQSRCAAALAER